MAESFSESRQKLAELASGKETLKKVFLAAFLVIMGQAATPQRKGGQLRFGCWGDAFAYVAHDNGRAYWLNIKFTSMSVSTSTGSPLSRVG